MLMLKITVSFRVKMIVCNMVCNKYNGLVKHIMLRMRMNNHTHNHLMKWIWYKNHGNKNKSVPLK